VRFVCLLVSDVYCISPFPTATWTVWSLCHNGEWLARVIRPMGGGHWLKASQAGNGGVGSASNGSKTATSQFGGPARVATP
jgi:hypothetical protein